MGKVRFTRRARNDLLDIWAYIARDNHPAAGRVYDRSETACLALRDFPERGPARPNIAEALRMIVVGRWLALYRLVDDGVQVVRIIDGTRDLTNLDRTPV